MQSRFRTGHYHAVTGSRSVLITIFVLCALSAMGCWAAVAIVQSDYELAGMTSHVPWGMPHVVAISLILGAPGALHIATLGSLIGRQQYQPWSRLSSVTGICMLVAGLLLLVLDLGKPGRLLIAVTNLNFSSVFSWNLLLYIGFILIVITYVGIMMNRRRRNGLPRVAIAALLWRVLLTTATASIFAVLPGRAVFPTVLLVVLFIALSWLIGTAVMVIVMSALIRLDQQPENLLDPDLLGRLLVWLLVPVIILVTALYGFFLVTGAYQNFARFVLAGGNVYTNLFWIFVGLGCVVPLFLGIRMVSVASQGAKQQQDRRKIVVAMAGCILAGCLALVYVLVITSQGWQVALFVGREVLEGSLVTGMAPYTPQPVEAAFAFSAVAFAALLTVLAARILPLLPDPAGSNLL